MTEFTEKELALIKKILIAELQDVVANQVSTKKFTAKLFNMCDKENKKTFNSFKMFNAVKDMLRLQKDKKKTISDVLYKIKQLKWNNYG
jgi:hypothetical protein